MLAAATVLMVAAAVAAWLKTGRPWTAVAVVVLFMLAAFSAGLIR